MGERPEAETAGEAQAVHREDEHTAERRVAPTCAVCNENPSKYRCPACGVRTCSLDCSKVHKSRTGCTGKRSRTEFIAVKEFNDRQLLSDYGFLEEFVRFKDARKRARPSYLNRPPRFSLPTARVALHRAAIDRKIHLRFLSHGMQRRRTNSTKYDGKEIRWRVEWWFQKAGALVCDGSVSEDAKLGDVVQKHLTVDAGRMALLFKLKEYADARAKGLRVVLKKEGVPADKPIFFDLGWDRTLRDALKGKTVVEFPRLVVLLPEELEGLALEPESQGGTARGASS